MAEPSDTSPLEYIRRFVISDEVETGGAGQKKSPVRVNPVFYHPMEQKIKLSGEWRFRLDPEDAGVTQRWYADMNLFIETIAVPGSWQGQGFGGDGEDEVADFRLRARVFRATYRGTGWYARSFLPPATWKSRRIWLNFGGVHPSAEVWLNSEKIGENNLPFLPFGFEVTRLVSFDRENSLVVRVHEQNRMLGFTYNFQGNWSGIYRDVELAATGESFIEQLRIYPEVDQSRLRCLVDVADIEKSDGELFLDVSASPLENPAQTSSLRVSMTARKTEFSIPVKHPLQWSPDHPALYRVGASLIRDDGASQDAMSERVGFVKLSTSGKQFLINAEPYYLRGTGDFLSCPETGCPDTDRDRWRKKLSALRAYGYNYVRCQSFVYPPEYYDVADEVGLIIQSEMGMLGGWGGFSMYHVYPWPQPTIDNYAPIKTQWDGVVLRDVNHPSANIYCMSNEYNTFTNFPRIAWQCYHDTKQIKPSCLVIWTDGGYREDLPGDFVNDEATVDEKCAKPLIQHEFRWWSSYPDVRIQGKYSGAVRPYTIEIAMKTALQRKLSHILPLAAENSQRLQLLEARFNMELVRRSFPNLAGICHFNAMDTNPSPQGILDEFYEQKIASRSEWLQTNGDTVVLSDLGCDNVVYRAGDRIKVGLWVSDFSHPPLHVPVISWKLTSEETVLCQGQLEYPHVPYRTCPAGEIEIQSPDFIAPLQVKLEVDLAEGSRSFSNVWDLWIFPREDVALPAGVYRQPAHTWLREVKSPGLTRFEKETLQGYSGVLLTETIDAAVVDFMQAGGRVILAASEGLVRPTNPSWPAMWNSARYFFTPPANYPTYEDRMSGTIIQRHPTLGDLPHAGFAGLQFFRMIGNSAPVDIEALGMVEGDPIIRCIHQYAVGRSLAYLVECAFGKGGLIVSSLDLNQAWPEALYLLAQLCQYAAGDMFQPQHQMTGDALHRLLLAGTLTAA